jgi:hypothetical protein
LAATTVFLAYFKEMSSRRESAIAKNWLDD